MAVGTLRLIVGGLALLLAAIFRRRASRSPAQFRLPVGPVLLAAGCMAAYQVLFFAGVRMAGVAIGTVVGIGSSPVLAGLLGFAFRGERPGWRWASATLLAVAGCAVLTLTAKNGANLSSDSQTSLMGMLLAVGAGGAYATFSLASKALLERQPVDVVMAVIFSLGALILSPLLLTQDLRWLAQPDGILAVLHLGLFATALAYLLFGQGLRLVPLATAVTLSLAEPLTAATLGVVILGERLSLPTITGIALIFSGLVVLAIRHSEKPTGQPGEDFVEQP